MRRATRCSDLDPDLKVTSAGSAVPGPESRAPGGRVVTLRIVRLGSARHPSEGTRIGTVRRPPRGVQKSEFATGNWYDVWFPVLAPSAEAMKLGQDAETAAQ